MYIYFSTYIVIYMYIYFSTYIVMAARRHLLFRQIRKETG
jgi:hypothetical protein